MAKIEKVLRENIDLDDVERDELVALFDDVAQANPGFDSYFLSVGTEIEGAYDSFVVANISGRRDESPAEAADREADAVAAERRELDEAKAKVAAIEVRLAGK